MKRQIEVVTFTISKQRIGIKVNDYLFTMFSLIKLRWNTLYLVIAFIACEVVRFGAAMV